MPTPIVAKLKITIIFIPKRYPLLYFSKNYINNNNNNNNYNNNSGSNRFFAE